jgi:hypothetical protein
MNSRFSISRIITLRRKSDSEIVQNSFLTKLTAKPSGGEAARLKRFVKATLIA